MLLIVVFQACNTGKDHTTAKVSSDRAADSIELRNLLVSVYKWYVKNEEAIDHNNLFTASYGIDTVKLDSAIGAMRKTGFFAEEFLTNYRQIGVRTNEMLERDSTLRMVGIAFPFQDYDTWHGGQGWQLEWDYLAIHNLVVSAGAASLKWTCSKPVETTPMVAKFTKENGIWKLYHLEYLDSEMYRSDKL